jgi:hypothetical protein
MFYINLIILEIFFLQQIILEKWYLNNQQLATFGTTSFFTFFFCNKNNKVRGERDSNNIMRVRERELSKSCQILVVQISFILFNRIFIILIYLIKRFTICNLDIQKPIQSKLHHIGPDQIRFFYLSSKIELNRPWVIFIFGSNEILPENQSKSNREHPCLGVRHIVLDYTVKYIFCYFCLWKELHVSFFFFFSP